MPRQALVSVENNFIRGLITEATGLNCPENAVTDTDNCVFDELGKVSRRLGFDIETASSPQTSVTRTNKAITTYFWKDVAGDGDEQIVVVQLGDTLHFYHTDDDSLSLGHFDTILLTDFDVAGSDSPETKECQFADGKGRLFVFHPTCESFYVTFDPDTDMVSGTAITLQIRDTLGEDTDSETTISRPSTLANAHKYNLLNQGWDNEKINAFFGQQFGFHGNITNGSPTIAKLKYHNDAVAISYDDGITSVFLPGMTVDDGPTVSNLIPSGTTISTVNATTLTMSANATGSNNVHEIVVTMGKYPSNADIWWHFKGDRRRFYSGAGSGSFLAPSTTGLPYFDITTIALNTAGNLRAPRGYYILTAYNQDRNTVSGLSNLTTTSSGVQRASTGAFFAGRVWYAGVAAEDFNEALYFSQIIETMNEVGKAYQANDPTSEFLNVLLPTDGGVIRINGSGSIIKLLPIGNSLLVFATNGVWSITGSQGIGFIANDYSINKISSIPSLSASSFVDVNGIPMWWNLDGIYTVVPSEQGFIVQSLTEQTIQTEFNSIPVEARRFARGFYDQLSKIVQWLYWDGSPTDLSEFYEFNRVMNLNVLSKAFYDWTLEDSDVKVHGVTVVQGGGGQVEQFGVIAGADTVIDSDTNTIVATLVTGAVTAPVFKYLVTDGTDMTFAENLDTDYKDWGSTDETDYDSYFVTGYRIRGDAQRRFQSNYIWVYADNTSPGQFSIQGIWDYALNDTTNRFSTVQTFTYTDANYAFRKKKIRLRGHGHTAQYKISSVSGEPFDIVGWSVLDTVNAQH